MTKLLKLMTLAGLGLIFAGATKGENPGKATTGTAAVDTTATAVFTNMPGRNAFAVFNNGPNTIYCGWRSNVTTATGFPIPAGAMLGVDLAASIDTAPTFYCITTALQVSPADTRWIQVK